MVKILKIEIVHWIQNFLSRLWIIKMYVIHGIHIVIYMLVTYFLFYVIATSVKSCPKLKMGTCNMVLLLNRDVLTGDSRTFSQH